MIQTKKRVLIVDDDVEFGKFVKDTIEEIDCETFLISNPVKFKEAFKKFRPDVIVLDVTMPEIDGIELVHWLAEIQCKAKIIIVSGYDPIFSSAAQDLGEFHGLARPMNLRKPFQPKALQALIIGTNPGTQRADA
jgi:DNA-binding response OmpR family regulator